MRLVATFFSGLCPSGKDVSAQFRELRKSEEGGFGTTSGGLASTQSECLMAELNRCTNAGQRSTLRDLQRMHTPQTVI